MQNRDLISKTNSMPRGGIKFPSAKMRYHKNSVVGILHAFSCVFYIIYGIFASTEYFSRRGLV